MNWAWGLVGGCEVTVIERIEVGGYIFIISSFAVVLLVIVADGF